MLSRLALALLLFSVPLGSGPVRGQSFTVQLQAEAGKTTRKAETQITARGVKPKARAVLTLTKGERVRVKWALKNSDVKTTFKDMRVHCFVVKEEKLGQTKVPKLNKGVAVETVNVMDFKPGESTKGELEFFLEPGIYLLRLETVEPSDDVLDFAALDLEVR